ncbi:hypothetical protein ACQCVP_23255 [Rossellomorea vietnamensis]|uniref:Ger(x)C family spore germination protein n=1 Tax=Rossellomorea vietnamensis TaxID=218284 RepID=UPI003CEB810C
MKNIQDLTYIVSMGMDYDEENKEFKVYIQGLNFANVAKQEGSRPTEPVPIFIASATGETLNLAVSKLYKKSEPPLFFGHVVTLVLTESVMKEKFQEVMNEIGRNCPFARLSGLSFLKKILRILFQQRLYLTTLLSTLSYSKGKETNCHKMKSNR